MIGFYDIDGEASYLALATNFEDDNQADLPTGQDGPRDIHRFGRRLQE